MLKIVQEYVIGLSEQIIKEIGSLKISGELIDYYKDEDELKEELMNYNGLDQKEYDEAISYGYEVGEYHKLKDGIIIRLSKD